jgi:hypothetical protein
MSDDDKRNALDAIAEQWINIVLAHIESKKQQAKEKTKAN